MHQPVLQVLLLCKASRRGLHASSQCGRHLSARVCMSSQRRCNDSEDRLPYAKAEMHPEKACARLKQQSCRLVALDCVQSFAGSCSCWCLHMRSHSQRFSAYSCCCRAGGRRCTCTSCIPRRDTSLFGGCCRSGSASARLSAGSTTSIAKGSFACRSAT